MLGRQDSRTNVISTDYLVKGAGAAAMAFVDTLLSETNDDIVMADRRDHPGGHWNDAYAFVHLHQPSAYYGVCSRDLGRNSKSSSGPNAGLYELASRDEVLDYYDQVMRERFLPSGRVRWLSMSEHAVDRDGTHRVTSLLNGVERRVEVRKKFVETTLASPEIPLTHKLSYEVASGVDHISVNRLPEQRKAYSCFTVVGGGKTGMDACLWLLEHGVDPDRLRWILPRDFWMMDRANIQPFSENFERTVSCLNNQFQSIIDASDSSHLFELLEARGLLLRLTSEVQPSAYRCALTSRGELDGLRRIKDVLRRGHVKRIERDRLEFEVGSVNADPNTLYIDCSASALPNWSDVRVFDGETINLLWVRWCQPIFSAALIAYVEAHFSDEATKNVLCRPVDPPGVPLDWLKMWGQTLANFREWNKHPQFASWLSRCRLDSRNAMQRGLSADDPRRKPMLEALAAKGAEAAAKIPELLAEAASRGRSNDARGRSVSQVLEAR